MHKSDIYFHLLAFCATLLLWFIIQPYQLGFTPDSMSYLEVASNIKLGNGITNNNRELVNHWPPLFSILVAFISKLTNTETILAGTVLQLSLYYAFIVFFMSILRQLKVNIKLIILSGILIGISPASANFLNFLSEGLFIVLMLLSFLFFYKWINNSKLTYLVSSAIFCGLFLLTRYAGIAFVVGYIFYILFFQKEKFIVRARTIFIYLFIIGLVISPWLFYQSTFDPQIEGRKLAIHIITFSKLLDFFRTVSYWFLGSTLARFLFVMLFIIGVFKINKSNIRIKDFISVFLDRYNKVAILSVVLILVYPVSLIVSISFYDSYTPLDNRILSPIFPLLLLLIILILNLLKEHGKRLIFNSIFIFLSLSFSTSIFLTYKRHYEYGRGYTKKIWAESQTVKYLRNEKGNIPTYSNGVEVGKLFIQDGFQLLPRSYDKINIEKMRKDIFNGSAQIVFFKNVNWRNYLISEKKLEEIFDPRYFIEFKDGFIIRKSISE